MVIVPTAAVVAVGKIKTMFGVTSEGPAS